MVKQKVCPSQPFKGLNMEVSLHVTIQARVLMDTLAALGAKVRWASYNTFSIQGHAAAENRKGWHFDRFAWKRETLPE